MWRANEKKNYKLLFAKITIDVYNCVFHCDRLSLSLIVETNGVWYIYLPILCICMDKEVAHVYIRSIRLKISIGIKNGVILPGVRATEVHNTDQNCWVLYVKHFFSRNISLFVKLCVVPLCVRNVFKSISVNTHKVGKCVRNSTCSAILVTVRHIVQTISVIVRR